MTTAEMQREEIQTDQQAGWPWEYGVTEEYDGETHVTGPFADAASAQEYIRVELENGAASQHTVVLLSHPSTSPVQPGGRW